MDLAALADELYALDPSEFTAARDARAASLRHDGDRAAADATKSLKRPSPAAWVVNVLARERASEMTDLPTLGARFAEAQADLSGPELRQLAKQRQQAVTNLLKQARQLAFERGRALSDAVERQVEETLNAAVADPAAASAVSSGRLIRSLEYGGLGDVDLTGAVGGPLVTREGAATSPPAPVKRRARRATDELPKAEETLVAAEREAADAAEALRGHDALVDAAQRDSHDATTRVAKIEQELADARARAVSAEKALRLAQRDRDAAQRARESAEEKAASARAKVARLRGDG